MLFFGFALLAEDRLSTSLVVTSATVGDSRRLGESIADLTIHGLDIIVRDVG